MSGKLKVWSVIKNLPNLKKYLFKSEDRGSSEPDGGYNWDSDWGWEDVDIEDEENNEGAGWLGEINVSISPTGDVMVLAREKRMVILSSAFEEDEEHSTRVMKMKFSGEPAHYEDDVITAVLCVPLHSSRQSNHGAPDWTCVVVGFQSGFVRFYSDNGGEILSQRLHNTAVLRFRLRTYEPSRHPSMPEQMEELTVLFSEALVCVEGFSLYQSLRACRSHLARASAGGSATPDSPPLSFKKWSFRGQESVDDHASLGVRTPNSFDHLVTASLLGGPYAVVSPTAPTHCVYAGAGRRPFVGLYYAPEGGWQPMLTDVARLVANKVKTALFSAAASWLGARNSPSQGSSSEETDKIERASSLPVRYGLPDKRREVITMELAPDRRLAATVDTFGRVLIIDLIRGVTLRMWKGYRDAQIAWLEREEDRSTDAKRQPRRVMFLVFYAPRRGILEVWAVEQGPRVAAFNVGKGGHLLSADFRMLGLNNTNYHALASHKTSQPLYSLFFMDRDGRLHTLDVPFHLCLTDRSSHRAHDAHLLKQVRQVMREGSCATADETMVSNTVSLFSEFRLVGFLEQAVERFLNTRYLSVIVLEQVFKEVVRLLESGEVCKMSSEPDKQRLQLYSRTVLSLLETFTLIRNLALSEEEEEEEEEAAGAVALPSPRNTEDIIRPHLPDEWADRIPRLTRVIDFHARIGKLPKAGERRKRRVPAPLSAVCFLGLFYSHFTNRKEGEVVQCALRLAPQMNEGHKVGLGRFLFRSYLMGEASLDDLVERMRNSCIPQESFTTSFISYFLSEERFSPRLVDFTSALLQQLLQLKAPEVNASAGELRSFLDLVEREVRTCRKLCSPLLLTISVVGMLHMEIKSRCKLEEEEDVSNLSPLLPHWLSICRRCEDTLALQLLLVHAPVDEDPLPTFDRASTPSTTGPMSVGTDMLPDLSVSLTRLSEGGRGFVTELMARWATRWRLTLADVQCLYFSLSEAAEATEKEEEEKEEMEVEEEKERVPTTQELFALLYDHFPMALEMDSLLANVAWEYIFLWSKDVEDVSLFNVAIDCLRSLGPAGALICHGVASMAWHMHLEKIVQCTTYLIDKIGGKLPKERLCRRDTHMSAACLRQFIHHVYEFMELFKQANCDADVVPAFMMDESWRSGVDGRLSLVELAIDQPITNYGLLLHHSHLLFVLDAILTFDIRGIKPYSLFDTRGVNAFFKSLTSHPVLPGSNVDAPVQSQRQLFITKVLAASVRVLKERGDDMTHNFFRDRIVDHVAGELGIEADTARRLHIVQLYSHGLDERAEVLLSNVDDLTVMTSQLLLVVGQRCAHMIFPLNEQMNLKRLGLMPPVLETYLKTSNYEEMSCTDAPVASTQRLVELLLRLMPDDHHELHRARLIADLVERFHNLGEVP